MDFNTIYKNHYRELYCFGMKQREMSAEITDILQDVFTKLYHEMQSGVNIENPRAWLYKVFINSIRTNYSLAKNRTIKKAEISYSQISEDLHEDYITSERQKIILAAIHQMPEKERNILQLYHNGFSYQEISDIMNLNYASIGTYISRSVEKLRSILKTQYNELFE